MTSKQKRRAGGMTRRISAPREISKCSAAMTTQMCVGEI